MMPAPAPSRTTITAALAAACMLAAAAASAQTAAVLYERARTREAALTRAAEASADDLRAAAGAYESVVRRHPTSGYADNALWQAAGLLEAAFERSRSDADRDKAVALLRWLAREYPHSPLQAEASARLSALQAAATTAGPPRDAAARAESAADAGTAAVRSIAYTPLPRGDRLTIELSREATFRGDRVADPDRVFFDFASAAAASALASRAQTLRGRLFRQVRVGQPQPGVTRVVLELTGAPRYSAFPLYGPFRLVIDLETDAALPPPPDAAPAASRPPAARNADAETPTVIPVSSRPTEPSATAPAAPLGSPPAARPASPPAAPPAPPAATSGGDYSLARQLGAGISRVVIDAGHGGHDPGAIANGVREAELVLDIALRLEKLLKEKPGFDAVLTRRTNEFIPLEERTAIANREAGDLFLSIHANAGRTTSARGIETYFLNFATNPEAEAVAARENATSAQTMGTLPKILKAIALNNKLAESRELASILQTTMVRRLRQQNQGVRDLGVKQAPFVVLIGAQMPSVLAEIAFVTNRTEAALLKQPGYRQQIAQSLFDAIVRYQGTLKKSTTVPSDAGAR
jgi:N-acetylmuramoyl-L-alanine amidase